MASTNQSPFYHQAEARFLSAKTNEEKITALEEMIRECPKHKSSEKMLANLKTRYKKLLEQTEKSKKNKKSSKSGIKKEDMQAIIIGKTNSGKSSLLNLLTNASPEITEYPFTTKQPVVAIMHFSGTNIQLIENPAIESEYYDKGLTNSADVLLIIITELNQIQEIESSLNKISGKRIIVFNKSDKLNENEKRKISSNLQSKKHNFILISCKTEEGIEELKNKIFQSFSKIRVYTKEPGKNVRREKPLILEKGQTIKDVAEKILHGFAKDVKEARVTGPSSKFPNQRVSLNHQVMDLDVVEFKVR